MIFYELTKSDPAKVEELKTFIKEISDFVYGKEAFKFKIGT